MNILASLSSYWRTFRYKGTTIIVLIIIIVGLVSLTVAKQTTNEPVKQQRNIPTVEAAFLSDITDDIVVKRTAVIEAKVSAPLIARAGGRVTKVHAGLGSDVLAYAIVVEIDGAGSANPTRVQAGGLAKQLQLFDAIKTTAVDAANIAIDIAQQNLDAAKAGRTITADAQAKNRELAANAIRTAQVNVDTALEANVDLQIRAANIAFDAAGLAQDQATIAQQQANRQTADALQLARRGLENAQTSKERTLAELAGQRQQLQTSLAVAQEQVRFAQVLAPTSGTVSRLTVRLGDYVQPGQVVGEISGGTQGYATVDVPPSVATAVSIGDPIPVQANGHGYQAKITGIGNAGSMATGLRQVTLAVPDVDPVDINTVATVSFPAIDIRTDSIFIPLDIIVTRQGGTMVFTVDASGRVSQYNVDILGYSGQFAQALIDIPKEERVIIQGARTLQAGDTVGVSQ